MLSAIDKDHIKYKTVHALFDLGSPLSPLFTSYANAMLQGNNELISLITTIIYTKFVFNIPAYLTSTFSNASKKLKLLISISLHFYTISCCENSF